MQNPCGDVLAPVLGGQRVFVLHPVQEKLCIPGGWHIEHQDQDDHDGQGQQAADHDGTLAGGP